MGAMTMRSILQAVVFWVSPLLVIGLTAVAIWSVRYSSADVPQPDHLERELALYRQVRNHILSEYVDPVDAEDLLIAALNGMPEPLDPHSSFQDPGRYANFRKATDGLIPGGIGVRMVPVADGVRIITPLRGTPAHRAGILPEDLIVEIDGQSTRGLTSPDIADLLGGEPGSEVELRLRRETLESLHGTETEIEEFAVVLERENILLDSVGQVGWADPEEKSIGYVRLSSFQGDSGAEVRGAIEYLLGAGMTALIFDLRGNLGGRLSAATEIADLFLAGGVIVRTVGRRATVLQVTEASAECLGDFGLVVLVDDESASASEVVAGALQDHHRAVIVGERTWGKGSVQEIFPLDDDRMALKLTTKRYVTPLGRSLHRETNGGTWGIAPDFPLALSDEEKDARDREWADAEIVREPHGRRELDPPFVDRQVALALALLRDEFVTTDPVTYR